MQRTGTWPPEKAREATTTDKTHNANKAIAAGVRHDPCRCSSRGGLDLHCTHTHTTVDAGPEGDCKRGGRLKGLQEREGSDSKKRAALSIGFIWSHPFGTATPCPVPSCRASCVSSYVPSCVSAHTRQGERHVAHRLYHHMCHHVTLHMHWRTQGKEKERHLS